MTKQSDSIQSAAEGFLSAALGYAKRAQLINDGAAMVITGGDAPLTLRRFVNTYVRLCAAYAGESKPPICDGCGNFVNGIPRRLLNTTTGEESSYCVWCADRKLAEVIPAFQRSPSAEHYAAVENGGADKNPPTRELSVEERSELMRGFVEAGVMNPQTGEFNFNQPEKSDGK